MLNDVKHFLFHCLLHDLERERKKDKVIPFALSRRSPPRVADRRGFCTYILFYISAVLRIGICKTDSGCIYRRFPGIRASRASERIKHVYII